MRDGFIRTFSERWPEPREYRDLPGHGIDRIAMLSTECPTMRAFFEADVRWLEHYGSGRSTSPPSRGLELVRSRIDEALFSYLTRDWESEARQVYPSSYRKPGCNPSHIHDAFTASIQRVRARYLCGHDIAGLGICAPLVATHPIEEAIVIAQISIFCCRCRLPALPLGVFDTARAASVGRSISSANYHPARAFPHLPSRFDHFHARRIVSLPTMLLWRPESSAVNRNSSMKLPSPG